MNIWTTEEEAEKLNARFLTVNRAAFARDNGLKGGQAIIYQHITGRRPISLDAALAYVKGFSCNLEEISPRLAMEVMEAAAKIGIHSKTLQIDEIPKIAGIVTNVEKSVNVNALNELISAFLCSDDEGRSQILRLARDVARESTASIDAAANDHR
jgi:hypothetical protein